MGHVTPTTTQEDSMNPNPTTEIVDDADELVTEDLIEEVSIDGMCGVY
jgi:mycofactocin precursor